MLFLVSTLLPNLKLARSSNQVWFSSVAVPLALETLTKPFSLSKPEHNLPLGSSQDAFNKNQPAIITLLIHNQFGNSYAKLEQYLHIPSLNVAFKSKAKHGSVYVAKIQLASAFAMTVNLFCITQFRFQGA